jgi:hypothetical protein
VAEGKSVNCLACGHESFHIKTVNGYPIRKCVECRMEFCWPMPSDTDIKSFYATYSDPLARHDVARLNAIRNMNELGLMCADHVLDFGCGAGVFVRAAHEAGLSFVRGSDPYRGAITLPTLGPWEWITLWGVLEHLTEPRSTLRDLRERLTDGGRIAITTLSIETLIPYRHKPPEHTLYFTRASIEALADSACFKVIEYRPYKMVQDSDVYLDTLLRTMPDEYQAMVSHSMPKYVEIPTNEVFVVLEKA